MKRNIILTLDLKEKENSMAGSAFHDRDGFIWFDGRLVPWRDANVHVLTHGLHYASSVFEGERAYGGKVFKLRQHSERLIFSAGELGFKIPYSAEAIDAACDEVIKVNGLKDCYLRPVAWRGSEKMGVAAQDNTIHLAIAAWEWPSYFSSDVMMKGLRLTIAKWRRPDPATAPSRAKAAGLYMISTLAKHDAEAEGYDDALMCDWLGRVAECTAANVFFVMPDGKLHTPTADCFINGITRQTVMDLARARGIAVVERRILPEELGAAVEVFVTGTAAEVIPIGSIAEYKYAVGNITKTLMADYAKATGKL